MASFPVRGNVSTISNLSGSYKRRALEVPPNAIHLNGSAIDFPDSPLGLPNPVVYLKSLVQGAPTADDLNAVGDEMQSLTIDGSAMAAPATSGDSGIIDVEAVVDCTAAPDQDNGVFQASSVSQGVSIIKTSTFYNQ